MNRQTKQSRRLSLSLIVALALALGLFALPGCDGSDDDNNNTGGTSGGTTVRTYTVTVVNLTSNQPLSPLAAVLHQAGYSGWQLGSSASQGLEWLAEGGSTMQFLNNASGSGAVYTTAAGSGPIPPGGSATLTLSVSGSGSVNLTVATMLVNTNDAFTGRTGLNLDSMTVGRTMQMETGAYDAGTEANSETAGTIPGPAGGGEGFNANRNDRDFVSVHAGVVTAADGLATSALGQSHRFDNPVARLVVTRTQ